MTAPGTDTETRLGCWFQPASACFRVWAPAAAKLEWIRGGAGGAEAADKPGQAAEGLAMQREPDGTWYLAVEQRGANLVAQTQDGRRGVLQDTSGIQRG